MVLFSIKKDVLNLMELCNSIIEAAKEAGNIMLQASNISAQQQEKSGDYNLVTAYDVAVQNFLFQKLRTLLPETNASLAPCSFA